MCALITYLLSLRNKVFKLLPMREAYDQGVSNHLNEYIENLYSNFTGSFNCYPELMNSPEMIEVYNNIAYLLHNNDVEFTKWRSLILRSTRLIQAAILRYEEV